MSPDLGDDLLRDLNTNMKDIHTAVGRVEGKMEGIEKKQVVMEEKLDNIGKNFQHITKTITVQGGKIGVVEKGFSILQEKLSEHTDDPTKHRPIDETKWKIIGACVAGAVFAVTYFSGIF